MPTREPAPGSRAEAVPLTGRSPSRATSRTVFTRPRSHCEPRATTASARWACSPPRASPALRMEAKREQRIGRGRGRGWRASRPGRAWPPRRAGTGRVLQDHRGPPGELLGQRPARSSPIPARGRGRASPSRSPSAPGRAAPSPSSGPPTTPDGAPLLVHPSAPHRRERGPRFADARSDLHPQKRRASPLILRRSGSVRQARSPRRRARPSTHRPTRTLRRRQSPRADAAPPGECD